MTSEVRSLKESPIAGPVAEDGGKDGRVSIFNSTVERPITRRDYPRRSIGSGGAARMGPGRQEVSFRGIARSL